MDYFLKKRCNKKIDDFIEEDNKKRKSSEEIRIFYVRQINSTKCYHYIDKGGYIDKMHKKLKEMEESRKEEEYNNLSQEEKEEIRKKEEANIAPEWWSLKNRGGKKKMKTRRNKIKGRKSRKSKFSKNTRKRINKKRHK